MALLWNLATGKRRQSLPRAHDGRIESIACLPPVVADESGRSVAVTVGADRAVIAWDLNTGRPQAEVVPAHPGEPASVACATVKGDGVAVTGDFEGDARVWTLVSSSPLGNPILGHTDTIRAVTHAWLDGRRTAVTCSVDGTINGSGIWPPVFRPEICEATKDR
jgi:WD40 repeat protein